MREHLGWYLRDMFGLGARTPRDGSHRRGGGRPTSVGAGRKEKRSSSELIDSIVGRENMEAARRHEWVQREVPPLSSKERGAVTILHPKLAAILYERIWAGVTMWVPDTPLEVMFAERGEPTDRPMAIVEKSLWVNMIEGRTPAEEIARQPDLYESYLSNSVEALERETGSAVGRLYATKKGFDTAFGKGDVAVLHAALSQMPLIDESKLEWKQVLEIRKDKKGARKKIRDFLSWADVDLVGKKPAEISTTLEERMHAYLKTLKTEGIKTLLTTASILLPALSAAVGQGGLTLLLAGQTGLKLSKQLVGYRRTRRQLLQDPPVAFFSLFR